MADKTTEDDVRRYRRAADDALQQLDWCIGYLHGIGKVSLSRALSRNRSFIREHMMHVAAQPLPSSAATADASSDAE